MGAIVLGRRRARGRLAAGREPVGDLDVRDGPLEGTTVEAHEVPLAIDELPLVALLGLLRRGRDGRPGRRRAAAEGIRPDRHRGGGAARARRRHRGERRRLRRAWHGPSARPAYWMLTATTGWRCSARSPGWRPSQGVEVIGMEAAAVSYPRFRRGRAVGGSSRRMTGSMAIAIDGPAGAGKSTVARAVARALGFTLSGLRGDVSLRRARRRAARRAAGRGGARRCTSSWASGCCLDGARRQRRDPHRRGRRGRLQGRRRPRGARARWSPSSDGCSRMATGSWRAATSARWSRPDAELKVFLTADAAGTARRRAAELGADPEVVLADHGPRRARQHARALAAAPRRPARSCSTAPR